MNGPGNDLSDQDWAPIEALYKDVIEFKASIPTTDAQPLINRVFVLPEPPTAVTKSGIIVPDTARERPSFGIVVAAGPGRISDHGVLIPTQVELGARVSYGKWSGSWIYDEKLKCNLLLLLDGDCLTHKPQPHFLPEDGFKKNVLIDTATGQQFGPTSTATVS